MAKMLLQTQVPSILSARVIEEITKKNAARRIRPLFAVRSKPYVRTARAVKGLPFPVT